MPWEAFSGGDWKGAAPYAIVALVLYVVVRRNLRPRPLKIERMWFYPVLVGAAAVSTLASQPPPLTAVSIAAIAAALIVGVLVGWQRGRLTHITIDPATHDLTSKTSPVGMALVLALFGLKFVLRAAPIGKDLPLSAAVLTDASLLFATGLMVAQRLEMWIRARGLLAEAQAAKALAPRSSTPDPPPTPPSPLGG